MTQYEKLVEQLRVAIPEEQLIRDELRLFACSTDASFYRLVPKLIVRVNSETEVVAVMRACSRLDIPFTFRAAGTSLSGQAVSNSVLIQISRLWNDIDVSADGKTIRCAPAVLGGDANRALARFGRKIGPDPASVDSAMIGGIAANNASGMCCGNVQDTYHTMAYARIIFADGTVLDTGSAKSRARFLVDQKTLVESVARLARTVKTNPTLSDRIRRKYRIKNTTGYSLHALVDFEDPIDILQHLLIGSEGTLAFFSEVTYDTVPDHACRATGLVIFPNVHAACEASSRLSHTSVAAVELLDRQSLRAVENKPGIPKAILALPETACALLVEVRAGSDADLEHELAEVFRTLINCDLLAEAEFTRDKAQSKRLWEIRKGLFPSLGYNRQNGTTIIIEDVAFPIEALADAARELRELLERYGYKEGVIFGHALQGNLHFVFCVDFQDELEARKYAAFLEDVVSLTCKYDGSLKAEHGTGRNMAPFVEAEWGSEALAVMREIKAIFDPKGLLNPGVILSDDPRIHVSNLKRTPASHPAIEKCTECGFCERTCPSRHLTLTPRQRIAGWREISRLGVEGGDDRRLRELRRQYAYAGDQTCAVDGLCASLCPVGINTGTFIKELRHAQHGAVSNLVADGVARHFALASALARAALAGAHIGERIVGPGSMRAFTSLLRSVMGRSVPQWNPWIPKPARVPKRSTNRMQGRVVYFPSCVCRLFGSSSHGAYAESQQACIERLLERAGYSTVYPENLGELCCGMAFSSKGFSRQAEKKLEETILALRDATNDGECPVVIDTSPCAQRLKEKCSDLKLHDVPEFLTQFVAPRLRLAKARGTVAVHVPCSIRNTKGEKELVELARMCAEEVFIPDSVPCCGFAGDRGFSHPELTASALVTLKREMPKQCEVGFSTSRTCEIGVSLHSGISYQSIAYLVDEAARAH